MERFFKSTIVVNGEEISAKTIEHEYQRIRRQLGEDAPINAIANNNDLLTQSRSWNSELQNIEMGNEAEKEKWIWLAAKKNAIHRTLMEQEAGKVGEIPFSKIKEAYQEMSQHYGGEEALMKKVLEGLTPSENPDEAWQQEKNRMLEALELSLKVDKLCRIWERELPPLLDEDFEEFYEKNSELYHAGVRQVFSMVSFLKKSGSEHSEVLLSSDDENKRQQPQQSVDEKEAKNKKSEVKLLEKVRTLFEKESSFDELLKSLSQLLQDKKCIERLRQQKNIVLETKRSKDELKNKILKLLQDKKQGEKVVYETPHALLVFFSHGELPAGRWAFEQVKEQVEKDTQALRKNQMIASKLEHIRKSSKIEYT